ncbi:TonB-dependent receptor [Variovorax sp. PCZ-1]|uniref:TonB-dependent receptor n=1 Tax=Variovorax sp. PCZ-1 TaxID=2835533 RepID=UPI001BCAA1D3|nr:TonB-dependent receptor [Variovorax sp. PCZ-1]MBS7807222.1 TonB-dependent receptor [Variovorax sp. PCZ-1]
MKRIAYLSPLALAAACCCTAVYAQSAEPTLKPIEVPAHYDNAVGTSDAASQGSIRAELLKNKPALRPGEVLEFVPGMVVTQHSGDGKANQYFLRGFNLDHGTDFATTINGLPVNMPTHAHGHGYTDINFLIPELVERIDYRKGPYFATHGDFAAAGAADILYRTQLAPIASLELGARGYRRGLVAGSGLVGGGLKLLGALELSHNDGPWALKENFNKTNAVVTLSDGNAANGWNVSFMDYRARWRSTDQIPERLIGQPFTGGTSTGIFDRFDAIDTSNGGRTQRSSLSGQWRRSGQGMRDEVSLYAMRYSLDLYSNFTYFTKGAGGDQFLQKDARTVYGGSASRTFAHSLAGKDSSTQFGAQLRHDRIRVGLFDTEQRNITNTTRDDSVRQTQTGLFAENSTQWLPMVRTVAGIRWDGLQTNVNSLSLAANSGKASDSQISPKFSVILGPFNKTEFFFNAGKGFHSNDARGTTITTDPATGLPADRVPGLAASHGIEIGARTEAINGLQSSIALWRLNADSELVYVGDAGATEAGEASKRYGIEFNNRYTPMPWLIFDADFAWTHARFANGDFVDNSVDRVASFSATVKRNGWSATLATRYIGSGPLEATNTVRSRPSITTNLRLGYQMSKQVEFGLDVFNLFNRRNDDIQYFYESQLPGEAAPVADRHIHPGEPRSLRLSMKVNF